MRTSSDYVKNYYSDNLDQILSKYIKSNRYGDLVPVIKDIFQRRAYEFDFSDKHIEYEVKNFIKKVKKIEFVPEDEKKTYMGLYSSNKKKIFLNETYFSRDSEYLDSVELGEKMYEVLAHEVYHAISDRPNGLGVTTYDNSKREWKGNALNEIITEVAADRASQTRTRNDFEHGRSKTDGYSDITFVVNLLSASVGLTEKEFLRAGIQNRKELMKAFYSKFPSKAIAKTAKKEYFDKIEASLDTIYNLNYEDSSKDDPVDIKRQIRESALTTLYKNAYELAIFQISHDNTRTASEMADEASFRFLKMENILLDSSKYFQNRNYIYRQNFSNIYDGIHDTRHTLANEILKLTGKRSFAELDKNSVYRNSYGRKIIKEDYDNGKRWNNSFVSRMMIHEFDTTLDEEMDYYGEEQVAASQRITEPVPIIDEERTEQVDIVDPEDRITEQVDVVDSKDRITEPMDVAQVRRITQKVATVRSNQKENKKSLADKFKQTIDIIITRFKNRKLSKLTEGRKDRSEYYASLVNNNDIPRTSEIDKYRVNVTPLRVENMTVGTEERKNERNHDEGR